MVNRTPTPFRAATRPECTLLEEFYRAKFGAEQAAELVASARIVAVDYIPDSPGEFGVILMVAHGLSIDCYEVFKIKGQEITYMPPAEAITTMHRPAAIPTLDSYSRMSRNQRKRLDGEHLLDEDYNSELTQSHHIDQ